MVKLARGGKNNGPMIGRQKPRPLFPPGELPLFGPPPAYMRRPPGPPRPPPAMGPMGYGPPPPPPPPPPMRPPPHHMGPPMPPPPPMRHRPRPVLPPPGPPMPLLQAPIMPPRPLPFMRGGRLKPPMGRMGMGMGMGMGKRLGKPMKKTKNKKNKNKTTAKNDGEHYCESCDRGWDTPEELEEHLATHVQCEYDNCSFIAHPKVVAIHVKLQHLSGLFDRIKFSYSKDEIDKWIEDRKRHYPTQQNVVQKLAMEKEKEERGETMDDVSSKLNRKIRQRDRFGNRKNTARDILQRRKHTNDSSISINKKRKRVRRTVYIPTEQTSSERDIVMEEAKLVIQNLVIEEEPDVKEKEEETFSDEEWNNVEGKQETVVTQPKLCGVLAALCAAYNSDSDEDEEPKQKPSEVHTSTEIKEKDKNDGNNSSSDDEPPEEISTSKDIDTPNIYIKGENNSIKSVPEKEKLIKKKPVPEKTIKKQVSSKNNKTHCKKFRKPTLLEMLLASEIRQERNYILQCIRYIINNNYFEDKHKNCSQDLVEKNRADEEIVPCSS